MQKKILSYYCHIPIPKYIINLVDHKHIPANENTYDCDVYVDTFKLNSEILNYLFFIVLLIILIMYIL